MTNTEAQQVLGTMLMKFDPTDAELQATIKAGEALEDDWISVEDRLPEFNKLVIVCEDDREVSCGRYTEYKEWQEMNENYFTLNVTHWRPLPDGPEDK